MAFLSWLANSEEERQRALDFVALFDEPGTVDELGVGVIRDAIADQLSPGTGTVQTRPRYFLFVPWIYSELERRRVSSADIARKARGQEVKVILALSATDEDGVIGRLAGKELKRLPSAIYWSGLGSWGIRRYTGPQSRYHRSLDGYYDALRAPKTESVEGPAIRVPPNWDPNLPSPPDGFPGSTDTLALTVIEAEYLRDRIMSAHPGTMLAYLVDRGELSEPGDFPWTHPQLAEFPPKVRELLHHAQCFSEVTHGAALLYNLLVAELLPTKDAREEWTTEYRDALAEWAAMLDDRTVVLSDWNRAGFWQSVRSAGAHVGPPTQQFVDSWLNLVIDAGGYKSIADTSAAKRLVASRERQLKKGQARLDNPRARELWGGASGVGRIDYRWRVTRRMIGDILEGLSEA